MRYLELSTLKVDAAKCTGCGMCVKVCPHAVLEISSRKAAPRDLGACMECGACSRNCPAQAISVEAGVGCANAILNGMLTGQPPTCGCGEGKDSSCCS